MLEILTRAGCFIAIILMGNLLRRVGFFKQGDFEVLSKIVVKITLTAVIVTSFSGQQLDYSMLILTLIVFGFGVILMLTGYFMNLRRGRQAQAFGLLNTTGCNVGNFIMPFALSFLGPSGVMAVSLFDVGNSLVCLGGAFGIASTIKDETKKFSLLPILKAMSRSVPLMTYLFMTLLAALHLTLPGPVIEFAEIIGRSNAFLAMLMIGVGFRLSSQKDQIAAVLRVIVPRYAIGITLAVLSFLFLPFPLEHRQALTLLFLSPIASAAPGFTGEMKGDYGLSCAVNSFSILISMAAVVTALLIII